MKLHVIASGSDQNAYVLDTPDGQLLLECGVRYPRIQQALDFDFSRLVGCLVTHEHQDHARSVRDVCKAGIGVYMSAGTAAALDLVSHRLHIAEAGKIFTVGGFDVLPFQTEHDCAEPMGWLIRNKATGEKLVFATDTYYLRYQFTGVHYWLLECNYQREILMENVENGLVGQHLKRRVMRSHFELENVVAFLEASDTSKARKVVLLHASRQNSDIPCMVARVINATGIDTCAAEAGSVIDLNLHPF